MIGQLRAVFRIITADENLFRFEESMATIDHSTESRRVSIRDVICDGCGFPATLDDRRLCELCRARRKPAEERDPNAFTLTDKLAVLGIMLAMAALLAWSAMR